MKELIEKQDEYINLLAQELNELSMLASVHGWKTGLIEKGVELRAEIEQLKLTALRQSEWVSVEERLPTKYSTVTIYCDGGENTAIYIDGRFECERGYEFNYVSHWKHLSTPPKEK